MKTKILILLGLSLAVGIFLLSLRSEMGNSLTPKAKKVQTEVQAEVQELKPAQVVITDQDVAALSPTAEWSSDDDKEISNINYDWLAQIIDNCHPSYKDELAVALKSDGVIRKGEYDALIRACNDYANERDAGAKQDLADLLK